MTQSHKGCYLFVAGLVLASCVLLAQSMDTVRSKRAKRDSDSLYDNIYSAIAEFSDGEANSGVRRTRQTNLAEAQAAAIPRGTRQTSFNENVIVDGFPTGLPAGTPEGVKIALASAQTLAPGEMPPIPGVAGVDFPTLASVPDTGFDCNAQSFPGIYGDIDARCQVFYMCQPNGNFNGFLCPNGTVFNQQYFVCDWWYNVDCAASANFYALNEFIYQDQPQDSFQGNNNGFNNQNNIDDFRNNNIGSNGNNNGFGNTGSSSNNVNSNSVPSLASYGSAQDSVITSNNINSNRVASNGIRGNNNGNGNGRRNNNGNGRRNNNRNNNRNNGNGNGRRNNNRNNNNNNNNNNGIPSLSVYGAN